MIEVIDYQDIYSERIDSEEANYWGSWDKTSIRNAKEEYDIIKIILKDREYAGHLYGKFIGDLFYFDVILIKEEYRHQGLASHY